ncbi:toll-like receptor 4 [Aphidius gifuensis]|uniref:toll-like receptor 4 n=1 Tax=Aphidius gifuensis TaxID=684658 RepID=UPI001CDB56E3|nr:toll-like receptor 4 [Aphidius gifuensis]
MKESISLWIWITSIIIIRLQHISSSMICMKLKTIDRVCKTDEGKLIPYKPEYINSKNNPEESVEYKDNSINIIHDFVFYDSPSYRKTKSLKLRLSNGILIISPLTFHLSKLEHLEITPGSVMLEPKTFQRLNHLKSLKLKVNETDVSFYQVLPNFPNLESLELIEYEFESICDPWNTHLNISSLNYTASIINKLSSGSFRCLPNLKSLIITRTNVSVIVFGAFENLKNLERLELTSNWGITSIPRNFLHELTNLKILNLANNSILRIDSDAFAPINNNCQILNLSYNFLEFLEYGCFKNFECETVDLGGNNIQYIGSNEFKNSIIIRLFLDDNIINKFDNKRRWGLQNSTTVYFKYNYYETVTNTDKNYTHCYESDQDIYVICKKLKYISSVSQKVLPYRLLPTTLAIYDNGAYGINSDAFVDLSIETLIIESSADAFHVRENSFMNMKKLKNLQLITSRIILNEGSILPIKDTLENLTLSVDELYVYLCKVIIMLKKLKFLIIQNHYAFQFHQCGVFNNDYYITLRSLRYNGGSFEILPSKSFELLKTLEHLAIYQSSLQEIEAEAFNGLQNLRILIIQFNRNLTVIKKGVLSGLKNLDILILKRNSISLIEDEVFMDLNKTISLLDLSSNKIQSITQKTFEGVLIGQLDLSDNRIIHYDEQYMKVGTLYIFNNDKIIYKDDSKVTKIQSSCHMQGLLIICVEDNVMTFVSLNQNLLDPDIELSDLRKSSIDIPIEIQVNNISSIDKNAWTIEMGALVLNHAMKFVNVSNNQLVNIKAGTFKGMKCDYLDLSGNKILSHEINILGLADIKKWNINGHIGFQGHATKAEDP